jgi:hypothetical protein
VAEERDDDGLLRDQPHGRKGKPGHLIGRAGGGYRRPGGVSGKAALVRSLRIAQRRPQAILKITRYGRGGHKIIGHAHYVRRHGELALEDEAGNVVDEPAAIRRRVRQWVEAAGAGMEEPGEETKRKRRVTAHFVLDAGAAAKPEKLSQAAREFLAERFGRDGHEYWFVRHDDTRQPHVHVILNLQNGEGRRLHTGVAEVQAWREQFAETARRHGIEVDASRAWERGKAPARSRGYVRHGAPKPARWTREQVRRGLAARRQRLLSDAALASARGDRKQAAALKTKADGLRMRTDAEAVRRVAAEGRRGAPTKPWEAARAANAGRVAADARLRAAELEAEASQAQPDVGSTLGRAARQLRTFAAQLRPPRTRAQVIAERLSPERGRQPGADIDREPGGS